MLKPIVIYHDHCVDGYTAAWCFWRRYGDAMEYYPGKYQEAPPDVTDRDVYLVDFSYKRDVVEEMLLIANSVTLIDHHKSALEDLWDLAAKGLVTSPSSLDHSGAVLAWNFVEELSLMREKLPQMLLHIEDRDLWKFALAGTQELSQVLFTEEYDFKTWDAMMHMTKHQMNKAKTVGAFILKKHMKDVEELVTTLERPMYIGGVQVSVASMPYTMASDAGEMMSAVHPFAATYYDTAEHRCFSLRSNKDNPDAADVSLIAQQYGGGGHKHASGFKVARNHDLARA